MASFSRRGIRAGSPPHRLVPLHRPLIRSASATAALTALLALLLAAGCVPSHRRATWRILPLPRSAPHDGLAVVSQPDGYGLHIWLETDTRQRGICRPRWLPDPARLFNGNGSAPFSSGLATRAEFFEAVARRDVRDALRRQLEALCQQRSPRSSWQWREPPRNPGEVTVERLPMLEEEQLLPDREKVRAAEEALGPMPPQEEPPR